MSIKIRYNLGRGENYMKWKIEYPNKEVIYHNPNDVTLVMKNCKLKNSKATAKKIFAGAHKTVCAWILCDELTITKPTDQITNETISYNPRVMPCWQHSDDDVDDKTYVCLYTIDNTIYVTDEVL